MKTDNNAQFKSDLNEVLTDVKIKTTNDNNGNVKTATVTTNSFLTGDQLTLIGKISKKYDLEYLVKRSGAALTIQFNNQ